MTPYCARKSIIDVAKQLVFTVTVFPNVLFVVIAVARQDELLLWEDAKVDFRDSSIEHIRSVRKYANSLKLSKNVSINGYAFKLFNGNGVRPLNDIRRVQYRFASTSHLSKIVS